MKPVSWVYRPAIVDYIIESYAGTEAIEGSQSKRRVFLWEEDGQIKMGNAEAFVLHLGRHFDLNLNTGHASVIHALLRQLGENVLPPSPGRKRTGENTGTFKQPDPDEWVVGNADSRQLQVAAGDPSLVLSEVRVIREDESGLISEPDF